MRHLDGFHRSFTGAQRLAILRDGLQPIAHDTTM